VCVNFVSNWEKLAETFEALQKVFGDETMSRTTTYEWYRRFKDGRTSFESNPRLGRPSASTDDSIERVRAVIRSYRQLTVREVADEFGISVGPCHTMLTEKLNMHHVTATFVPWLLTNGQKEQHVSISQELLH